MTVQYCQSCKKDTVWDETPVCTLCGCFGNPEDDNTHFSETLEYLDTKQVGTNVSGIEKTRVKRAYGSGIKNGPSIETNWETFEKGKRAVLNLATALNLPTNIINSANNTYKLGLFLKFTSGRSVEIVAAACLYVACRLNSHPVLLFDFVDHISVRVSPVILSRVCIRLARTLSITLPPVLGGTSETSMGLDPSAFLYRFAAKMDLGDKGNVCAVAMTASRILKRMQEDWIHWGRHPSGLFGAALLIAARLHGFKRTRKEVSEVVYIGDGTVGCRVSEFSKTPSAGLSIAEFDSGDFDACDPPCYERAKLKVQKEFVKWPSKLPQRPEDVKRWIEEGMGFSAQRTRSENPEADEAKGNIKKSEELSDESKKTRMKQEIGDEVFKGMDENLVDEKIDFDFFANDKDSSRKRKSIAKNNNQPIDEKLNFELSENKFNEDSDSEIDIERLEKIADSYIISEQEKSNKTQIWDIVNKKWTEEQKRKEEERKLEEKLNEAKPQKKPSKRIRRTMPFAYNMVLEEFEKENSKSIQEDTTAEEQREGDLEDVFSDLGDIDLDDRVFLSENNTKRTGEKFFLAWSVIVVAFLYTIVSTEIFYKFQSIHYMIVGIVLVSIPIILPLFLEKRRPWYQRYTTKLNIFMFVMAWVSNYFWTHYFYHVLGASYLFPSWRFNDVPFCLYLMSHSYFIIYHTISTIVLRVFFKFRGNRLKNKIESMFVVFGMSLIFAFLEAYTLTNFPYYSFKNARNMYIYGSLFYSLYFLVSFPMVYRIDENLKDNWTLQRTLTEALACCMVIFQLLDFWRLYMGKIY